MTAMFPTKKNLNFSEFLLERLRMVWHLIFWGAAFMVLLKLFANSDQITKLDVIYTSVFLLPIILAVYLNLYILYRYLLRKQRYILYFLSVVILIVLGAALILKLFDQWIDYIFKDYYFISTLELTDLVLYSSVFILLTTLVKLSRERFTQTRNEGQKTRTQLSNLQAQINPHFLLNSLQTIYSLALNKSEKTPSTILQLSEILKFTLYESEDDLVSLERELEVVEDYVEMYRLRLDPIRAKINLNINGEVKNLKIIPLLFLPFIENSFKHGLQGSEKEAFVEIDFQIIEKKVTFSIENNKGEADHIEKARHGGIGISNTRQRLELYYKGRYDLKVLETRESYAVNMILDLN